MSPSTRGSATSARPTSRPPTTTWSASAGTPAVEQAAHDGQRRCTTPCGGGLSTTVLPATSAAPSGPAGERDREVERRDHRPHAVGAHHVRRGLGRVQPAHRLLEPVVVGDLVAVVADQVGRLLDVAERLEPVLAHLDGEQGGDDVAPLGDQVGSGLEEADAVPPRRVGPGRGEGLGDADRLGHVGRGRPRRTGRSRTSVSTGERSTTSGPVRRSCPETIEPWRWPRSGWSSARPASKAACTSSPSAAMVA